MFLRRRRPGKQIYGVIGSILCCLLWSYAAVLFAGTERNPLFPLAAAVIFGVCAWEELKQYRKLRNRRTAGDGEHSRS